jgi:hypothetical protein
MRIHRTCWLGLSAAIVAVAGGCADTATCDPNEILYMGHCMALPTQEPADAGSDGGLDETAPGVDTDATLSSESSSAPGDAGAGDASDEH